MGITSQRSKSGILKNCCRIELYFSICNYEVAPKLGGVENSVLTAYKGNNFVVAVVWAFALGMEGPEFYSTMTHKEIVI